MKNSAFKTSLQLISSNLKFIIPLLLATAICLSCVLVCINLIPSDSELAKAHYLQENFPKTFQVKTESRPILEQYGVNYEVNFEGMKDFVAEPDSKYGIYEFESLERMKDFGIQIKYRLGNADDAWDESMYLMSVDEMQRYLKNGNYATKNGKRYRLMETYFPDGILGAVIEGVPKELEGKKCGGIVYSEINNYDTVHNKISDSKLLEITNQFLSRGYFVISKRDAESSALSQAKIKINNTNEILTINMESPQGDKSRTESVVVHYSATAPNLGVGTYSVEATDSFSENGTYISWNLYKSCVDIEQSYEDWSSIQIFPKELRIDIDKGLYPKIIDEISLQFNNEDVFDTYPLDGIIVRIILDKENDTYEIDTSNRLYTNNPYLAFQAFGKEHERFSDTLSVSTESVQDLEELIGALDNKGEQNILLPYSISYNQEYQIKYAQYNFTILGTTLGVVALILLSVLLTVQARRICDEIDGKQKYAVLLLQMLIYAVALFVIVTVISLIVIFSVNAALAGGTPFKFLWVEWYTIPLALAIPVVMLLFTSVAPLVVMSLRTNRSGIDNK